MRVAVYARVSTRDREQDPDTQLVPLREYAHRRGWSASEYVDQASAADLLHRIEWARLLKDVRERHVDHVLAWKLDRCFRSALHCLRTLEEWEHYGVGLSCLTQDIDTTNPTGRLLLTVLAAVAEFERGLISERVREGMNNARRNGRRLGRPKAVDRPHVTKHLAPVLADLDGARISKREACRRLQIGMPTLNRILADTKREAQ
jgi:DNA invertase Pin-like site-specific DNA recombinase